MLYSVVTKFSEVVQMGMLNKSVVSDTISPAGGAKRFEKLLLQQQLRFQLSHTFSSGNADILV